MSVARTRGGAGRPRALAWVGAENLSLLIALALLVALIATQDDNFFSARNLFNIGQNMAVTGIVAVGMTLVIVSSGLDISVGAIAGCASVVCGLLVSQVGTLVYFGFFLLMPWWSRLGTFKPVPDRVTFKSH